jgi:maltokinase
MAMTAALVCPSCATAGHETAADRSGLLGALIPVLKPWLVSRRWFLHESGCLESLRALQSTVLHEDGHAALLHCVLLADHGSGGSQRYQVILGLRRTWPAHLPGRSFGRCLGGRWDGWWMYDATDDPEMMRGLIRDTVHPARRGAPALMLADDVPAGLVEQLEPRVLGVEQSNTSVVYGDRLMLKFFRSPRPGANREAAALDALSAQHCTRVPRLAGLLRTVGPDCPPMVLGVLTDFLENEGDGWERGVAQAARYLAAARPIVDGTGGFLAHAYAMGEAVAEVHACLGRAFGVRPLTVEEVLHQAAGMRRRLSEATGGVPGLEQFAAGIRGLYADYERVARQGRALPAQQVHGDLHLGQVLSTAEGWKVIDFEGEPDAAPAQDGRLGNLTHALTDVAGMFRSFDYAAQQALAQVEREAEAERPNGAEPGPEPEPERALRRCRAESWADCNRQAFAAGYTAAGGDDPFRQPEVLRALEADKAVYESLYEAHHRPQWLPIPLRAIAALAGPR